MLLKRVFTSLSIFLFILALYGQGPTKVRIVDLEDVAIKIENATSSSANGEGDFPVYLYGEKQMKKFDDLYMILVRHDMEASDPERYISVELIDMDDKSSIFEMAKYMRFSGTSEAGTFSIKLMEINTLQVLRKGY